MSTNMTAGPSPATAIIDAGVSTLALTKPVAIAMVISTLLAGGTAVAGYHAIRKCTRKRAATDTSTAPSEAEIEAALDAELHVRYSMPQMVVTSPSIASNDDRRTFVADAIKASPLMNAKICTSGLTVPMPPKKVARKRRASSSEVPETPMSGPVLSDTEERRQFSVDVVLVGCRTRRRLRLS
ncbi:hypothetical protein LTR56_008405 [Elasticomyces elasticus]|nr:hypothetical protein LTR22_016744 [Elasticomyces elasticus]KAK3646641.1 hypothetical protein LTR56_008405 [Elasticomyces elasticus]KAK4913783.1 hypothetical protein LTR49_017931 [Elasticomyces elasticus]KAK5757994.1 hypothetical protein LTS12_011889 [Elasticomyces elasticus]